MGWKIIGMNMVPEYTRKFSAGLFKFHGVTQSPTTHTHTNEKKKKENKRKTLVEKKSN
jgi:hypothetical protein